jgi:hypothetical protein
MLLFIAIAAIFLLVAVTRPGPNRLHIGRGRRLPGAIDRPVGAPDPTLGLRDPARRL